MNRTALGRLPGYDKHPGTSLPERACGDTCPTAQQYMSEDNESHHLGFKKEFHSLPVKSFTKICCVAT